MMTLIELLTNTLAITQSLANGEKLDTEDIETLADAYAMVRAWDGSGTKPGRDVGAERRRIMETYSDMVEEMI